MTNLLSPIFTHMLCQGRTLSGRGQTNGVILHGPGLTGTSLPGRFWAAMQVQPLQTDEMPRQEVSTKRNSLRHVHEKASKYILLAISSKQLVFRTIRRIH